jgi:hypothetical protein
MHIGNHKIFAARSGQNQYCDATPGKQPTCAGATLYLASARRCGHDCILAHKPYLKSVGSLTRIACFILLLALTPCTLYAGLQLYRAIFPWTGGAASLLFYAVARFIACILLVFALWQLRQAGMRLYHENSSDG